MLTIYEDSVKDVRRMAAEAMAAINEVADLAIDDIYGCHEYALERMDREEDERWLAEVLKPYGGSIDNWFDAQPNDVQEQWLDAYQSYQYGPGGDTEVFATDDDILVAEIEGLLRSRDSYLQQPFCPFCDSRGHEPGACMPQQQAA